MRNWKSKHQTKNQPLERLVSCGGPEARRDCLVARTVYAEPFYPSTQPVFRAGWMKGNAMFEIVSAKGGGYFWRLIATNSETLCHSEVYTTKQAAHNGIAAVKRIAPTAPVYER